jgi:large subunit ribosomal protein L24
MHKIIKGDRVIVIAGKDKGKTGTVLRFIVEKSKVVVSGVNLMKKHQKGNPQKGVEGGIISKEAAMHVSNVAVYNPQTKKADRVRFVNLEDGTKVRQYVSNGENVVV